MKKTFWIVAKKNSYAEVYLYGYIGNSEEMRVADFVKELKELGQVYDIVKLRINSDGGSVFAGLAIITAIKELGDKVEAYIDGVAASMAFVIAMTVPKRYMNKYARCMSHKAQAGGWGNCEELRNKADLCEGLDKDLATLMAPKLNMSIEDVLAKYITTQDKWMNADYMMKAGLIDGTYEGEMVDVPSASLKEEEMVNLYNTVLYNKLHTEHTTIII